VVPGAREAANLVVAPDRGHVSPNMPGIAASLGTRVRGRPQEAEQAERALFALVVNGAPAPSSKLAAADRFTHDVHLEGLDEVGGDACYGAMDWLHQYATGWRPCSRAQLASRPCATDPGCHPSRAFPGRWS
jgi:hypothetical protein